MRGWRSVALIAVLPGVLFGGCASDRRGGERPALITHPVFFRLDNPRDAAELIRDCDRWIRPIPGVSWYACGVPHESGREMVESDYDVGLILGFASEGDYASYLEHPDHARLREKWHERLRAVEIRDVLDATE